MDLIEKLFIAWVIIVVLMFAVAIYSLVLSLKNKRDIQKLQNS